MALAKKARASGLKHGVVQDKLFLPGLLKLKMLKDAGFFGRIFAVRGEFGYWVFEGDWGQPAQRPSWNYRKADGGGIILDMLCHWRYVLDNLFGKVEAVSCLGATHIPSRVDERGKTYTADADDAAYATFQLEGGVVAHINSSWDVRVRRDDLVTFQVDGTHGSAVAGLHKCFTQHRVNTPKPVWNPDMPQTIDFFQNWEEVPDNNPAQNGFKAQWEMFLRHVAEDAPWAYGLEEGAKGVQLAMAGPAVVEGAALGGCPGTARSPDLRGAIRRMTDARDSPQRRSHRSRRTDSPARRSRSKSTRRPTFRALPTRRRMSSPIRWRATIRGSRRRSTGTRRCSSAIASGTSASASPRRWTPRSAAWVSAGPRRAS